MLQEDKEASLALKIVWIQQYRDSNNLKILNRAKNAYAANNSKKKNYSETNRKTRFLSLRIFGLLSSSLLLFPQRFGQYVLRRSSGICRTGEPSRNVELRPLMNPWVN